MIASPISGTQTITKDSEQYDVIYSDKDNSYTIMEHGQGGADVTTEFLANNPSVKDKLDDYLEEFQSKASKLDDSVVDEISFVLEAKKQ